MATYPITTEHITSLAPDELVALAPIFRKLGHSGAADQCEALLAAEPDVDILAQRIAALPAVSSVPAAVERRSSQEHPVKDFSRLWRIFVVCGFSSQMNSNHDSPLDKFRKSSSPLLKLSTVIQQGAKAGWVKSQILQAADKHGGPIRRNLARRTRMIEDGRKAFIDAGARRSDRLQDGLIGKEGTLGVFIRLARGEISDRDLATSDAFSRNLASKSRTAFEKIHLIGPKQLRNILVNSGLAHNVLPLDSRWSGFLGYRKGFNEPNLTSERAYRTTEQLVRLALIRAKGTRSDITNLAILDSLVFDQGAKR